MTDDMTNNTFLTQLKTHPQVQNFRFLMILLLIFLLSLCYEDILPSIMSELQELLIQSSEYFIKGVYLWDARWFTTFAKWFIQNVSNNIWQ